MPKIYLTFDDGPTPKISDWVMDELDKYKAKASFFVLGKNVEKYPEIVHRMIDNGHSIGNHTYMHKNGWETENKVYLRDFLKAQRVISEYTGYTTRLYRPPYGKISRGQARLIQRTHQIVMMDVISGDFDIRLNGEKCFEYVKKYAKPGSIILMHDSLKAEDRLRVSLPKILKYFSKKGYQFAAISKARAKDVEIRLKS